VPLRGANYRDPCCFAARTIAVCRFGPGLKSACVEEPAKAVIDTVFVKFKGDRKMTTETKKQPPLTLRDGAIKASIWRNESESGGAFYTVNFARAYKDKDGKFHDTDSFSGAQLLKLSHLAAKAYDCVDELRIGDKVSTDDNQEAEA
jgi:hypothetical protein